MPDFFTDVLDGIRLDDLIETVNRLFWSYPLELAGVLFILLLALILRRRLKHRKHRPADGIDESETAGEARDSKRHFEEADETEWAEKIPGDTTAAEPVRLVNRLKTGLQKTRRSLAGRIETILSEGSVADAETLEEIEEALITSDVGVNTTMALIEKIRENASSFTSADEMREFLKDQMRQFLTRPKEMDVSIKPYVIMVVGVNGVGKTTTIGKLAYKFQSEGKKVLIGAADTFRAAAVEQLEIWAERSGADFVRHRENADPAAVAYDAVEAGMSRHTDIVIIDTAGRLQTKVNLMEQLKKIKRSIAKKMPDAPHEVMLILDATTGQNAISQAQTFHEGIGVTSLVLTKLDGTAKGGIVISICNTMKLPLQYIGVGEQVEDFQPFDPERFIDAIF